MNIVSLGKVVSVTPGTPVPLSASSKPCQRITFWQDPTATAAVFVGTPSMNRTTGVGVYVAFLPASTSGQSAMWEVGEAADSVDLSEFAIDSGSAGQGCFASYQIE